MPQNLNTAPGKPTEMTPRELLNYELGAPAARRELPEPEPIDGQALTAIAARHNIEIIGPPLTT
ncbi:hypothetical protein NicSoilB8_09970 [Arthrobacter sp. NicSoilB8]|nr:hypothetical protein NicSoilB8_09970 [Arthrobacter sp. NicSoilB8]